MAVQVRFDRGVPYVYEHNFVAGGRTGGFVGSAGHVIPADLMTDLWKRVGAQIEKGVAAQEALQAFMSGVEALAHEHSGEGLPDFLTYTPENSALRIFQTPTQTRPLGIRGEGLFSHLKDLSRTDAGAAILEEIGERLALIDWFDPQGSGPRRAQHPGARPLSRRGRAL